MSKITGKVKWFSNRKGFGFIIPTSDNAPTGEDETIFVHHSSIFSDGDYRTLVEGAEVEFEVEKEESGKLKAINVTAPGGGSLKPPPRDRRRRGRKGKGSGESGDEAVSGDEEGKKGGGRNGGKKKESKPREPPFHSVIEDTVKEKIAAKGVDLGQKMTIDVAHGESRVKLGQGGYAGLAHAGGMVGEGTYTCDAKGNVSFKWERCLEYKDGAWSKGDTGKLMKSMSLVSDKIGPVGADETAESLWGADKGEPGEAFEANGFKMKRVVLTRPPGRSRGRRSGSKKEGE